MRCGVSCRPTSAITTSSSPGLMLGDVDVRRLVQLCASSRPSGAGLRWRLTRALEVFNRQAGRMALSAIALAELMHGAEKSSRPLPNLAVVEDFCSRLEVLPYGPKAAQHYGQIRAAL